jgi:hypothetical protein
MRILKFYRSEYCDVASSLRQDLHMAVTAAATVHIGNNMQQRKEKVSGYFVPVLN